MTGPGSDFRLQTLTLWAADQLQQRGASVPADFMLTSASDDASFRRYFRGEGYVFMDAPPELEDCQPFVDIARLLKQGGVNVPEIFAEDHDQGFLMLSDFGHQLYLDALAEQEQIEPLYQDAMTMLARLQQIDASALLPPYSRELLLQEMSLFPDWFYTQQLGLTLSPEDKDLLDDTFELLIANAQAQPQVLVHRDYHSRNLMVLEQANPGVLDFQDAVVGPVTYDLVSLFRDCYIRWPDDRVYSWLESYRQQQPFLSGTDPETFQTWFDLMGLQRHIKVAGIFSRLNLRDGKPRYLADIPLVMDYIVQVCSRHAVFADFHDWLMDKVMPVMKQAGIKPL